MSLEEKQAQHEISEPGPMRPRRNVKQTEKSTSPRVICSNSQDVHVAEGQMAAVSSGSAGGKAKSSPKSCPSTNVDRPRQKSFIPILAGPEQAAGINEIVRPVFPPKPEKGKKEKVKLRTKPKRRNITAVLSQQTQLSYVPASRLDLWFESFAHESMRREGFAPV